MEPAQAEPGFMLAPIKLEGGPTEALFITERDMHVLAHHLNYPELYDKDAAEIDSLADKLADYLRRIGSKSQL